MDKRKTTLIQIGCNVGDTHIFELIRDKQINLCIFVDANKVALEQCLQNSKEFFKDANWDAKFEFINCAVSNLPDNELEFHIPNDEQGHNGCSSLYSDMVEKDYTNYKTIKVQNVSANSIFKQYNLKRIDYLFIDVEGADKGIVSTLDIKNYDIDNIKFEFTHWGKWKGFEDEEEQKHLARIVFGMAMRRYKVYQSSATDITATRIIDWHENYMG
tara:strand:- start:48 stop:692 length:645 start_codon:yes stop_codon:yes gene_type:complete